MKRMLMALSLITLPATVFAAPATQPAVDAYYHDMLALTHDANQAGEACMGTQKRHQEATPSTACRQFEKRYQQAVDQSASLAARLKMAGQSLHHTDDRLVQLTRATETLNHYMDRYQAQQQAGHDDVMRLTEEPATH